jgi:anti-sigma B factor antagonist
MPVDSRLESGAAIVTITGRLTIGRELERLEGVVKELLAKGHTRLVFDLSALDYSDSSGIGSIVSCLSDVKRAGGEIRLAGANSRLQRLFKITGVDGLMSMYQSVKEATV